MAWSDLTDLANTACRSVFGQTATVGGVSITAIYGNESTTLSPPGEPKIVSSQPVLDFCVADLVTQPTAGTVIVVGGITWIAHKVSPDGQGMCRVQLRRQT